MAMLACKKATCLRHIVSTRPNTWNLSYQMSATEASPPSAVYLTFSKNDEWNVSVYDVALASVFSFLILQILRYARLFLVAHLRDVAKELKDKENALESLASETFINIEMLELNLLTTILIFFPSASAKKMGKLRPNLANRRKRQSVWGHITVDEMDKPTQLLGMYGLVDIFWITSLGILIFMRTKVPHDFGTCVLKILLATLLCRVILPIMTAADRIASRIAEIWKDPIHGGFQHLSSLFKVTLFIVLTMGILKIFGFNMSALFAGLGIGGLAIGLALQATLKDILGSMILIADHPIKCGDYVNVGMGYAWAPSRGYDGTVEEIGLRSTKIRMKDNGQLLYIPNADLATCRIVNQSDMVKRRHDVKLCLRHDSPVEKLRLVGAIFKDASESIENLKFEEFSFDEIIKCPRSYGHTFIGVYYVNSGKTDVWKRSTTELHFRLLELLHDSHIELSTPPTLLHKT